MTYGRLIYRFRWFVLILWVGVVLTSLPFANIVGTVLNASNPPPAGSESARVDDLLNGKLHQAPSQAVVVFQSTQTPVNDPAYQQELHDFMNRARTFQYVSAVVPGSIAQDGRTTFVLVNFDKPDDFMVQRFSAFRKLLPTAPAQTYVTGSIAVSDDFNRITVQGVERADSVALPISLVLLLIIFSTLVAAVMPLLLAVLSIVVALAIIYALALHLTIDSFVLNIISIVGLGVSIDYSLLVVRRFREELAKRASVQEAMAWTLATAGEAILFGGLTVAIGFAGLLLFDVPDLASFGLGGIVVVAIAVLAALTLLPAILSILGKRINALRIPLLWRIVGTGQPVNGVTPTLREPAETYEGRGFWSRWALGVMRRPVLIILVVGAVLLSLSWPVLSINIGSLDATSFPAQVESRHGLDLLNENFPDANLSPIFVVVSTPDGSSMLTASNLNRLATLTQWLSLQPHVTSSIDLLNVPGFTPQQLIGIYSSGVYRQNAQLVQLASSTTVDDTTLITLKSDAPLDSAAGKALIDHLRADSPTAGNGLVILVGGVQATSLDFLRSLYAHFLLVVGFILLATFILLLLMFRSLLLPLKACLMNILSVGVAYGVLVFIFQWGNFSGLLGFTSNGILDHTVPVLLFCVLFGLSMDYEVFLLSRIREEWLRTGDNRQAVAYGLEKTGSVITNAALLFIVVAASFSFTSLVITKEIGVGITAAVLVDATIIRSLLVPATMCLLGRWNWWLPGQKLAPKRQIVALESGSGDNA
jgi:RND superfamily putative drug exporter